MILRPGRPQDVDAVAAIWWRGWHDAHDGQLPAQLVAIRTAESFAPRVAARVPALTVAVAAAASAGAQETVAGFIVVTGDEVQQVYVDAAYRGGRVASALLTEAERQVAAGGYPVAWLAVAEGNARARRFYERCGFSDAGPLDYQAETPLGPVAVATRRYVKRVGR